MKSLSRDEVRAIDRCAIEQVGVAGVVLMENAGRQAADAAAELLGDPPAGKSAAIVSGESIELLGRVRQNDYGFVLRTPSLTK